MLSSSNLSFAGMGTKVGVYTFLGLDANMLAEIVVGDEVNLAKLVKHHFRPSKNMTEQKLNIRALVFCMLNHYLLSNNNGEFGDIRLIPLISQMESCYSCLLYTSDAADE